MCLVLICFCYFMSCKNCFYLFYDMMQFVCIICLCLVEVKIVIKDEQVYMDKWCLVYGIECVFVSDDVVWYW